MKVLVRFACSVALIAVALQAKADQVFDWVSQSVGGYSYAAVGPYDDGVVSGTEMKKIFTRFSSSILTPPATAFPAALPNYYAEGRYVVSNGQIVLNFGSTGTISNTNGDALFFTSHTTFSNGSTPGSIWHSIFTYTGGTGLYAGAYGSGFSDGTLLGNNTQSWISTSHLVIPSPVPEPETYAMLLAGLGLMAGVARRRKTA